MNTFQLSMLAGAAALALSVFWPQIRSLLVKYAPNVSKPRAVNPIVCNYKDSSLVGIIRCWEHLKGNCEKAGLKDACGELDILFPLLNGRTPGPKEEVNNV